ncbi:putative acetyltransferase [Bradyrhizobium elkanii]|jgi:predicted acetyltransferase|uniref:Putative acetyltransferase n=2 Tax=Bradyrhizobium TaxID=374 RepID=A0A8I1XZ50_BRAEL|nr:putative acetyltransferase [Bradyrhizobium elkanii]MCW2356525.1 putative acetyltransferase [Bradyrhizobium elkanii]
MNFESDSEKAATRMWAHKVELNNFDRWLQEIDRITDKQRVLYVHTK